MLQVVSTHSTTQTTLVHVLYTIVTNVDYPRYVPMQLLVDGQRAVQQLFSGLFQHEAVVRILFIEYQSHQNAEDK